MRHEDLDGVVRVGRREAIAMDVMCVCVPVRCDSVAVGGLRVIQGAWRSDRRGQLRLLAVFVWPHDIEQPVVAIHFAHRIRRATYTSATRSVAMRVQTIGMFDAMIIPSLEYGIEVFYFVFPFTVRSFLAFGEKVGFTRVEAAVDGGQRGLGGGNVKDTGKTEKVKGCAAGFEYETVW